MSFVALAIVDVTIGSMAAESTTSTSQTCPACATSIDTGDAEPLARVECPNCGEKVRAERMFDHFVIVETVGVGGMGTVYKALDGAGPVASSLLNWSIITGALLPNIPSSRSSFTAGTDHYSRWKSTFARKTCPGRQSTFRDLKTRKFWLKMRVRGFPRSVGWIPPVK